MAMFNSYVCLQEGNSRLETSRIQFEMQMIIRIIGIQINSKHMGFPGRSNYPKEFQHGLQIQMDDWMMGNLIEN